MGSRFTLVLFALISFGCTVAAGKQQHTIDSLVTISRTHRSDSIRVLALKQLSDMSRETDRVKAIDFAMMIFQIADSSGQSRFKVYAYECLGGIYSLVGKNNEALRYYDTALSVARHFHDDEHVARIANQLGKSHAILGSYQEAIEQFIVSLKYFESQHDSVKIGKCLNNIGNIYFSLGNFDRALEYYGNSLSFKHPLRNANAFASTKNNIAEVYKAQKQYDKAVSEFNECLTIYHQLRSSADIALTLANLSSVYHDMGNDALAEKYIRQSLSLYEQLSDFSGWITALIAQGNILVDQRKFYRATRVFERALSLSSQNNIVPEQLHILEALYKIKRSVGDYKASLQYLERRNVLRDSIAANQQIDKINDAMTRYQIDSRIREIDLLKKSNSLNLNRIRQREIIITLVIALLIITVALVIFIYNRMRINEKLRHSKIAHDLKDQKLLNLEMARKNIEFKLRTFRLQMNPHFIFNALNSIQGLIVVGDTTAAYKYLSRFSKLLRRVLEHSEKPKVALSIEIETLTHYIQIEKMRFKDDFEYEIKVFPDSAYNFMVPSLLLQPIVENSVKHGLLRKGGRKKISVNIALANDVITYVVEDNGIGREAARHLNRPRPEKEASMGLDMINSGLKAFHPRSTMEIHDLLSPGGHAVGTRVTIQFPVDDQVAENGDNRFINGSLVRLDT